MLRSIPGMWDTGSFLFSPQNSGNFSEKSNETYWFRFSPTGIFGTTFEGGPLWPVHSFRSVGPKCPFLFDKIVVPSTALLHPAYKNNTQMCCGLGSGQCIWNLPFHWACGVSKISNWNFYWTESIPCVSFCTELLSLPSSQLAITLQLG